jgi:uncharacterized membrane protein
LHAHMTPGRSSKHLAATWGMVVLVVGVWLYLCLARASAFREVLAVPFLLLVPGALFVMLLPSRPKDPFFQFALAIGLSIAWCIVIGLLLDVLPGGIDARTWEGVLGSLSVIEATIVAYQRTGYDAPRGTFASQLFARVDAKLAIMATLTTLIIVGALIVIVHWQRSNAAASYSQEHFAELGVSPASRGTVAIGVHSDTSGAERFRLSVTAGDRQIASYVFTLKWQQTWRRMVAVTSSADSRVVISLFNGSSNQPSERVWYSPSSGG